MAILEFSNVRSGYGRVQTLHGTSLHVGSEELVSIIGPNGAGKSTVLKNIAGLLPVWSGTITFDGSAIHRRPAHQLSSLGLSYVPQGRVVFPKMTVEENLLLGGFPFRRDRTKLRERLTFIFDLFPILSARRRQDAFTLSGGEQQVLAIGRALMSDPKALLLDEPSLGLSPAAVDFIFDVLLKLKRSVAMLMVEQNAIRALEISDRAYVLVLGQNRLEGTGADLLGDERVKELYLGGG